MRTKRRLLAFAAVILAPALILLAAAAALDADEDSEHSRVEVTVIPAATWGPGPPSPEMVATFVANLNRQVQEDRQKPRFTGALGDFVIVSSWEGFDTSLPCAVAFAGPHSPIAFTASELNLPETYEQAVCADGTVVIAYGAAGRRSYFSGAAMVTADAPRERLKLVDVDGRPGLLVEPPTPVPSPPWTLFVIQRAPGGGNPGILLVVTSRDGQLDAIERASAVLGP